MTTDHANEQAVHAQRSHDSRSDMPTAASPASRLQTSAAMVDVAAVLSAVAAFVTVSVLPTGLSPISAATSEWGLGSYAWCFRWFTVSLAVAGYALLPVITAPTRRRLIASRALLVTFAFGRSFVGWVPMDAPGAATTTHGAIHWALGILSFGSVIALGFVGAHAFAGTAAGHGFAAVSRSCGALAALGLLVVATSTRVHALVSVFGLFERFIYLSAVVWLAAVAMTCLAPASRRIR